MSAASRILPGDDCALKPFRLITWTSRASDGRNEKAASHIYLSYWNQQLSLPSWNVTEHFKFLLNLWVHPALGPPSTDRANILRLPLAEEETDACVVCRLSGSVDENQRTLALKNKHLRLKGAN